MEGTLEYVLWFIFAFILGFLILNFIYDIDYNGFYNSVKNVITGDKEDLTLDGKDMESAIMISVNTWKECGFGEIEKSEVVYINETGAFDMDVYFAKIKEWNLCNVISSDAHSCGKTTEVDFIDGNLSLPRIVKFSCDPASKKLQIN